MHASACHREVIHVKVNHYKAWGNHKTSNTLRKQKQPLGEDPWFQRKLCSFWLSRFFSRVLFFFGSRSCFLFCIIPPKNQRPFVGLWFFLLTRAEQQPNTLSILFGGHGSSCFAPVDIWSLNVLAECVAKYVNAHALLRYAWTLRNGDCNKATSSRPRLRLRRSCP